MALKEKSRLNLPALDLVLGRGNFRTISRITGIDEHAVSRFILGQVNQNGHRYTVSFKMACLVADAVGISVDTLRRYLRLKHKAELSTHFRMKAKPRVDGWL